MSSGMPTSLLLQMLLISAPILLANGIGVMVERQIAGPHAATSTLAWVDARPPGTTFVESFVCSPAGDLTEHATSTGERAHFAYDPAGRLLARSSSAGAQETYGYEGTGRTVEPLGPARSYGPGGALLARGAERFTYDAEGRRTGKADAQQRETRYDWNGRGMLAAVVLPDGARVENVYDTQGRRVVKRVRRPDGVRIETRFTWAGDHLIHEITWSLAPSSAPTPIVARAYVYDDDATPLAHRETRWSDGAAHAGEWTHYALGPGDMPALLIGGDGAIQARLRASVWGRVEPEGGARARTPLRFRGQYEDDETGLFYNGYRFYDPALGLYISADPIGLAGGLGAYEYGRSLPHRTVDPSGLVPVTCTVTGSAGSATGSSVKGRDVGDEPFIHPIVSDALPPKANGMYPSGSANSPTNCAEPVAISSYIKRWEEQNRGGRPMDPRNKDDHNDIRKCMGSITGVGASHPDGMKRAPCPNCSQMLADLNSTWGGPKGGAIEPGFGGRGKDAQDRGQSNFTPPSSSHWADGNPTRGGGTPYTPHDRYD